MKYCYVGIYLLLISLFSCTEKNILHDNVAEVYCYDNAEEGGDLNEVFSSVEITPLEYSGEEYPKNFLRLVKTDSLILVFDYDSRVTVFDSKGKYISSSAEKFGNGPEEFSLCLGFGWNPYSNLIEILSYGKFAFYDKEFNFVRSCKAPNEPGKRIITEILDLSPTRHILLNNDADNPNIYLFDSEKGEILAEKNYKEWNKGGGPSGQKNRFFKLPDGEIYCMPLKVTDKILRLNPDSLTFENIVTFLPGKNTFTPEEYEEMFADKRVWETLRSVSKESPLQRMFSSKKIFDYTSTGEWRYNDQAYAIDRRNGGMKKYHLFEDKIRIFPDIDDIDEEYAYSVISKERLAEAPKLLLDKADKTDSILSTIEDDTLILLKYKIRE